MADLAIAFARVGSPGEDPFDLEGDLLDSQIRVEKLVGEGELSVVYRGHHEGMNAPVAIKCLNVPETLDPKLVEPISESFREGARVHYRLAQGHLHIVQTLALGTTLAPRTGQQIPYIVREWLEGRSLAEDFAARARSKTRPRTSAQAVELLESAADAIAHAHAEGVCHHSLSPRNLFLAKVQRREVLKVLDFGMARDGAQPADAGLRLLSSHAAPEQLDRRIGAPCPATDVFAFALVLFEAVTGRPYFLPGAHASEVLRVAESREPLSRRVAGVAVPRDLELVLARALSPTPRERHANLRVFWDDVKRAVQRVSPLLQVPPKPRLSAQPAVLSPSVEPSAVPAPAPAPIVAPALSLRQSPTSCTAEVALPVTTSVAFESTPALTINPDPALERDTVPAPPMFDGEAVRASIPMLGGSLQAQFSAVATQLSALSTQARALLAQSPLAAARIGVFASVTLTVIVLFVAALARSAPKRASAASVAPLDHKSAHVATSETSALVVADTTLRVVPKRTAFDRAGTKRLFDETAAELESCTRMGGPRGPGSVRVIIHPSGKILRLQIGPPYAGTSTGDCISSRFVAMEIPAFVGPPQAVNYIFNTIPFSRP